MSATPPSHAELLDAVLFLGQWHGQALPADVLQGVLGARQDQSASAVLDELLIQAHLVATPLDVAAGAPVKSTLLPALLISPAGGVLVVLARQGQRYECHQPGVAGSVWLQRVDIDAHCPDARWLAVRPTLFLDQRSLLYTLPQPSRWFWDVFGRNRWIFRWALLGSLAMNVFAAIIPFFSTAIYDRVIPNNALDSLWVLTVAAVVVIGFDTAMRLVRGYLIESAARRMDVALSSQIFAHCLRLRAANRPASGGTLANVVRDFEAVREFFASSTLTVVGDLPFVLLFLILVGIIGGPIVLVPVLTIPVLVLMAWLTHRGLQRSVHAGMQQSAQRTAHLFETMNGLDTVKALGIEAWSRRKWESLTLAITDNSLRTRELLSRANTLGAAIVTLEGVILLAAGAWMIGEQALSVGQLIAVTMLTSRALLPITQLTGLAVRWQQTKMSFEALNQVMAAPTDNAQGSVQAPPLSGAIEFRDVTFAYPNSPPVLDGFKLSIQPGERVAFIGKLGSGKTTLLRLLLNQYSPQSGSVLVDNLVTTQLEPLSLRRQIGYVPQDLTLFHGTVRENIELGRTQASDQALLQAVRHACLDEVIAQLPAGLATPVGERGERLSGGQRQAVAIARALLTQPRVLLLDEPSSMMDPATEHQLIDRLRALKGMTILLVTHRMAMLALVDRLVVLDQGRIVADGPRDAVLKALAQQGQPAKPATSGDKA